MTQAVYSMWGGWHDRDAGSTKGQRLGRLFGSNVTVARAPSDELAYRISAGHYRSDEYARPDGAVPVTGDPRSTGRTVGGAPYPSLANLGTNQIKFDTRVDRLFENGRTELSFSSGVSTTEETAHTSIGPFDLKRGGYLGYTKLNFDRDALSVQVFANFLKGNAPSLVFQGTNLGYDTTTFDGDVVHRSTIGRFHRLVYGGNLRRSRFNVDVAPTAENRMEFGAFFQDEIDTSRFRAILASRVDKFGNIGTPFVSPRLALGYKFTPNHVVMGSVNRAFRAPSAVETFMEQNAVVPIDLSGLAALGPLLPSFVPPGLTPAQHQMALASLLEQLDHTTSRPFLLHTRAVGGTIASRENFTADDLVQESVTAYEVSYTGTLPGRRTTIGAAAYVNDVADVIGLTDLPLAADPYTANDPPPGWVLPPQVLTLLGNVGQVLPRTTFLYGNLGSVRRGLDRPPLLERHIGVGKLLMASHADDPARGTDLPGHQAEPAAQPSGERRRDDERHPGAGERLRPLERPHGRSGRSGTSGTRTARGSPNGAGTCAPARPSPLGGRRPRRRVARRRPAAARRRRLPGRAGAGSQKPLRARPQRAGGSRVRPAARRGRPRHRPPPRANPRAPAPGTAGHREHPRTPARRGEPDRTAPEPHRRAHGAPSGAPQVRSERRGAGVRLSGAGARANCYDRAEPDL